MACRGCSGGLGFPIPFPTPGTTTDAWVAQQPQEVQDAFRRDDGGFDFQGLLDAADKAGTVALNLWDRFNATIGAIRDRTGGGTPQPSNGGAPSGGANLPTQGSGGGADQTMQLLMLAGGGAVIWMLARNTGRRRRRRR